MIRRMLFAAIVLLPQVANAAISGNVEHVPAKPAAYTVVALPANYESDPKSQELLAAFGTNPELLKLREATTVQTYQAKDPDFQHRWAARLPQVAKDGQVAVLVVQDDRLVYGNAGVSVDQFAAELRRNRVVDSLVNPSGSDRCPNCRPLKIFHPQKDEDEEEKPVEKAKDILRPILPEKQVAQPKFEPAHPVEQAGMLAGLVLVGIAGAFGGLLAYWRN